MPAWNVATSVGKMFRGTYRGDRRVQPTPRTVLAKGPQPNAVSNCPCTNGTTVVSAAVNANDPFQDVTSVSDLLCMNDMTVRATTNAWNAAGSCFYRLIARDDSSSFVGYNFTITDIGGGNATYELYQSDTFTLLDTATLAKPVSTDVLELLVYGDSIEGKKNGSSILTATDATIPTGQYAGIQIYNGVSVTDLEVDLVC